MVQPKNDSKSEESLAEKIEGSLESFVLMLLGIFFAYLIFYVKPNVASKFLIKKKDVIGLKPPGELTLLTVSLLLYSTFWFYYMNPDDWAFFFSYYTVDSSIDYSSLLGINDILQVVGTIIFLTLIISTLAMIMSAVFNKLFGRNNEHFRITIYVISINYAVLPQVFLLVLGIYSEYEFPDWILTLVVVVTIAVSLLSISIFIWHSFDFSEMKAKKSKIAAPALVLISYLLLFVLVIALPFRAGIGSIDNVTLDVPNAIDIKCDDTSGCDIYFYVTIYNKEKHPLSVFNPAISSFSIIPDPRKGLPSIETNIDTSAVQTSSNNPKVLIIPPNQMGWIYFRVLIPGFNEKVAQNYFEEIVIEDSEYGSAYYTPAVGISFYLQAEGNIINDDFTKWLNRDDIEISFGITEFK